MNSIYSSDKFTKLQQETELTECKMIVASQEHLAEVLENTVKDIVLIVADSSSSNRDFFLEHTIRNAMTEAICVREATAQYNKRLEMS